MKPHIIILFQQKRKKLKSVKHLQKNIQNLDLTLGAGLEILKIAKKMEGNFQRDTEIEITVYFERESLEKIDILVNKDVNPESIFKESVVRKIQKILKGWYQGLIIEEEDIVIKFGCPEDAMEAKLILDKTFKNIETIYIINYQFNFKQLFNIDLDKLKVVAKGNKNLKCKSKKSKKQETLNYRFSSLKIDEITRVFSEIAQLTQGKVLKLENCENNTFFQDFESNFMFEFEDDFNVDIKQDFLHNHFTILGDPENI